jgi:hypothetical protein
MEKQLIGTNHTEDIADISALRLPQDFATEIGVQKVNTGVAVKKPENQWFVRTRSEETFRLKTCVLDVREDRESYLVAPELWNALATEITAKILITSINRQGTLFLWPIRWPGADGKIDEWNRSALEAAQLAMKHWVRVKSNQAAGTYDTYKAIAPIDEPTWPDMTFQDIINMAFKGRCITTLDHPVIKKLRGEA